MKFKFASARAARSLVFVFAALLLALTAAGTASAQEEGVPVVLDEPIVQVNNDVIMLSTLKRENREFKEVLIKQRNMTPEQAEEQVAKKQSEIIVNLINEALLMQKAKDTPRMSEEIEADINREMLRVANSSGLKTLEELDAAMKAEGLSLAEVRETMRRQFTRQAVLQNEVDRRIFLNLTPTELKKYYDANRSKFESVTLSEIYLGTAGRNEAEVRARAAQIAAQARTGTDFGTLAAQHSEREKEGVRVALKSKGRIEDQEGKLRPLMLSELHQSVQSAIKDLKAGGVSEPIKTEDGFLILRVEGREDSFRENAVRIAIVQERGEKEREDYMRTLRQEAYIKAADNYKEIIQPLLDQDAAKTPAKTTASAAKDTKEKK